MNEVRDKSRFRKLLLWPLLLLIGGIFVSLRVARLEFDAENEQRREGVRVKLELIQGNLSRELYGALYVMEGVAGLIAIEGGIAGEKFHAFAQELYRRTDLIRNIAIAPNNVVQWVYPLEGNESAIGLEYERLPSQWPSVERTMQERRLTVAGPVELVQGGVGVIGRTPVFLTSDRAEDEQSYWGLVSTVLEFDRLLQRAISDETKSGLNLALRGLDGTGSMGAAFWGESGIFTNYPVTVDVALPSGSWQLAATPSGGWPRFTLLSSSHFSAGVTLSGILAFLLFGVLRTGEMKQHEVMQRRHAEQALTELNRALERVRDELEERVVERTKELEIARDAAQSADRLKSAFLATMSHELRTPLNSVIGFSGILLQRLAGPLNDEQVKQLKIVSRSAKHLLALITDVLDLSKIEAGQMKVFMKPFNLRDSIHKTMATVRLEADRKGLALECDVRSEVGQMTGDQRRVEQVLINLLANAVKFTEEGHVRVEVSATAQDVSIRIKDTGPGIDAKFMDMLFLPFSQIDNGLDRKYEGTGLGLSTSKGLVELMGGRIWVESEPGVGSTFGFSLPLTPPPRL